MLFYFVMGIIFLSIGMSIRTLFIPNKIKGKHLSLENFMVLASIYATVMIGFGLIYFLLEIKGFDVLFGGNFESNPVLSHMETSMYFSAITLFSVGYGDIAPIGIGRIIAVLEALIGYTIPAAFVARAVFDMEKKQ